LRAPQAKIGLGYGLRPGFVQDNGLPRAGLQAFMALFGTLFQRITDQLQLLAAPVHFPFRQRRAGFRALALIHLDFGQKGSQRLIFGHNGLGLPVIAQGYRARRAEMGTDLAEHASPGIDVDVQLAFAGNNGHRLPGAGKRADVAFEALLLIQAQFHPVRVHPQGQFQTVVFFPFFYLGKHRQPKSRKTAYQPATGDFMRSGNLFSRSLAFQMPVKFPGLVFKLPPPQPGFQVGKLRQQKVEFVAGLEVRTLIALLYTPLRGAPSDGAILLAPAFLATRTHRVVLKPIEALAHFREAEPFVARKTVNPPVAPETAQVFLEPGDRGQKRGIAQLAIVTQTAKTCSIHLFSPSGGLPPKSGPLRFLVLLITDTRPHLIQPPVPRRCSGTE
jgi:hypothetical protein